MTRIFALMTALMLIFCGGSKEQPIKDKGTEQKLSPISKGTVLMVIAPNEFRDEEFKEPFDLLVNSGFKVVVASVDTNPAKGMLGMVVKPDVPLTSVIPDSFVAIIIVGGVGCKVLWDNSELHKIVQDFNQKNKIIAAICIAPVVLARAGVLKDKKATVYPGVAAEIKPHCAEYTGRDVERSENIITGAGPQAAKEFAKTILEAISN